MVSEQGLNVYGAVTWGQFFVYQGFNAHNGWMHTSYGGDAIDEYAETIVKKPDGLYYRYGAASRKLRVSQITIAVQTGTAARAPRIHGVSQPSRPHHPRRERPVDRHQAAAVSGAGAGAIVLAHQDQGLRILPQDPGHAHRHLQQHRLCRRRRHHRLLPRQFHSQARSTVRLHAAGGRQRSGHRMAGTACPEGHHHPAESRAPAGFRTPTTGPSRRRARTARSARTIRPTCGSRARIRAAFTPSRF